MNEVDKMILDERKERIEELKIRIDRAIEYIESHNFYALEDKGFREENKKENVEYIFSLDKTPILKILKGDVK